MRSPRRAPGWQSHSQDKTSGHLNLRTRHSTRFPGSLPHLRGTNIFLSSEGTIVPANSAPSPTTGTERPELFIYPTPNERKRQRRNLGEAGLFPPASVARKMVFVDPALRWRSDV